MSAAIVGLLYNLTDEAIRACPPSTQWVVATNGDNLYARDMFQTVMDAPANADVVALDYYSRYQRTTGPPCARFAMSKGAPPCKENRCASSAPAVMCCQQHCCSLAWLTTQGTLSDRAEAVARLVFGTALPKVYKLSSCLHCHLDMTGC